MSHPQNRLNSVILQGGINFRDQGGYRVQDGRKIKYNQLFRSGSLHEITEQDCQVLTHHNINHILDYRDKDEITSKPDILWQSAQYKNIPANLSYEKVTGNLGFISNKQLESFSSHEFMLKLYSILPFQNPAYHYLVELLQKPEEKGLIQHCAIGKDRTGVGSALVLFILGVDEETIMEDYLLTETTLEPYREKIINHMAGNINEFGINNLRYILSAKAEFLASSIHIIKQRYQNVDNWLVQEFNLTEQKRELIQSKYLEEAR